jgi:hypothetical protein
MSSDHSFLDELSYYAKLELPVPDGKQDTFPYNPALPFGGYKQSGWGRESGHAVLVLYTEVKAVCAQV